MVRKEPAYPSQRPSDYGGGHFLKVAPQVAASVARAISTLIRRTI